MNQDPEKALVESLQKMHYEVHAVYPPSGIEPLGDCYCAAVDLFKPGQTYKVFFKVNLYGDAQICHIEEWLIG